MPGGSLCAVDELAPPTDGDDWVALSGAALPVAAAGAWAVRPDCGAVVTFTGTSRDHSGTVGSGERREGVTVVEYEAYAGQVERRLSAIASGARQRWPGLGRLALLHRTGEVPVGEASVCVVASAPHRDAAFEAARFGIDTIKATVPIWKRERWDGGEAWGLDAHDIVPLEELERVAAPGEVPAEVPAEVAG
jgi:molybdopterin synthase catalytic subunit